MESRGRRRWGALCAMLLACLWLTAGERVAGEGRVRIMFTTVSANKKTTVIIGTEDQILAYNNDTSLLPLFPTNASEKTWPVSAEVRQAYDEFNINVNSVILDLMAVRLPGTRIDIPTVRLYPEESGVSGRRVILNCLVSDLFPPAAEISFRKNGQPLEMMDKPALFTFDSSWGYTVLYHIETEPTVTDRYSCVVQLGNKQQIQEYWALDERTSLDWVQVTICALGFTIGLLGLSTGLGLIVYKRVIQVVLTDRRTVSGDEPPATGTALDRNGERTEQS
ncbi:H-2 class II histocompatibility antigen, E-U alpha chain-like [Hemiscyllium ocellatum]|uniref:H-2 class II histocompatibility antigen, E-U alpha chain-like n=1 Tax=Hemiscyllium ocellatum TaxID=170820 RepID=UPI002966B5FC|nr:H-2 class II histocompatibility antigen, E-U alpha chain-like [Hemiscyllium ocellatum]